MTAPTSSRAPCPFDAKDNIGTAAAADGAGHATFMTATPRSPMLALETTVAQITSSPRNAASPSCASPPAPCPRPALVTGALRRCIPKNPTSDARIPLTTPPPPSTGTSPSSRPAAEKRTTQTYHRSPLPPAASATPFGEDATFLHINNFAINGDNAPSLQAPVSRTTSSVGR